jgi:hypothetical protein
MPFGAEEIKFDQNMGDIDLDLGKPDHSNLAKASKTDLINMILKMRTLATTSSKSPSVYASPDPLEDAAIKNSSLSMNMMKPRPPVRGMNEEEMEPF